MDSLHLLFDWVDSQLGQNLLTKLTLRHDSRHWRVCGFLDRTLWPCSVFQSQPIWCARFPRHWIFRFQKFSLKLTCRHCEIERCEVSGSKSPFLLGQVGDKSYLPRCNKNKSNLQIFSLHHGTVFHKCPSLLASSDTRTRVFATNRGQISWRVLVIILCEKSVSKFSLTP